MKDFFEKNKVPLTIIVAAFLIAASIWLSKKHFEFSTPHFSFLNRALSVTAGAVSPSACRAGFLKLFHFKPPFSNPSLKKNHAS